MKSILSVTIEEQLLEKFKTLTTEKFINVSKLVQSFIERWVEEQKEKK